MISVAAGLARAGLRPWTYSIAPFLYARPFEQIRNGICLHNLPVVMVGNGGGYGYGVMGSTHHALEDYGALLTLPHLRAYIPAFDSDVEALLPRLLEVDHPAYLRLGVSEKPAWLAEKPYAPWRRILPGDGPTVAVVGPLVGGLCERFAQIDGRGRPDVWLISELPAEAPDDFLRSIARSQYLIVIEEHVAAGGAGQMLAHQLLLRGAAPARFTHRCALGYVSGLYGSQKFHRQECGLDPASVCREIEDAMLPHVVA